MLVPPVMCEHQERQPQLRQLRHGREFNNECSESQLTCKCQPGSNCVDGFCEYNFGCGPGQVRCTGGCVNTQNDNRHCGGCSVTVSHIYGHAFADSCA